MTPTTELTPTWMIRAGIGAKLVDRFLEQGQVAIGWNELGPLDPGIARAEIAQRVAAQWPTYKRGKVGIVAGQLYRFLNEIQVGDRVVTYDPGRRIYALGRVESAPVFDASLDELARVRTVRWESQISRDDISVASRNTLGAISTLFRLSDDAAREMLALAAGEAAAEDPEDPEEEDAQDSLDAIRSQSRELIKDRINELDPYELQDLVAGVLRAMGYKTRIAAPGADRGIDILASPDGFGFEQPRIIVECKHRTRTAMGAQEIRTFLGGRHKDDKGLYVSTGGFTKDARYEAERASIPTTLMDLDQLVDALLEHYDGLDSETRVLLPLTRLFWPAN
jgi:restriction system protein